jgi:hypothetical protein
LVPESQQSLHCLPQEPLPELVPAQVLRLVQVLPLAQMLWLPGQKRPPFLPRLHHKHCHLL